MRPFIKPDFKCVLYHQHRIHFKTKCEIKTFANKAYFNCIAASLGFGLSAI